MLEYREFPIRTASVYLLFAPMLSYFIFMVHGLTTRTLFSEPALDNFLLLGYGALAASLVLPISGILVDHFLQTDVMIYVGTLVPTALGVVLGVLGSPSPFSPLMETSVVLSAFAGLAFFATGLAVKLGRSIVVRFRGRCVGLFLGLALLVAFAYETASLVGLLSGASSYLVPAAAALGCVVISVPIGTWRLEEVPLAARGNTMRYFVAMVAVLVSHMLWYFSTKMEIEEGFAWNNAYESLSQYSGIGVLQLLVLAGAAALAGLIADRRGRKVAFSMAVLLLGLLVIFGSAFYGYEDPGNIYSFHVLAAPLLVFERTVEGFLMGLCLFLIWPELGSARGKGTRVAGAWTFFMGYMALFWALDLRVWHTPAWVKLVGGQFAILFALVALYFSGHLEEIVGREVEIEDLSLDFDESLIKQTVSAFLGEEDFESIRTQIDIIEATEEISDAELSDFLGEELARVLPLRRVPGIGPGLERRLRTAGYESAAQLAGADARRLASRVSGVNVKLAEKLIAAAREVVQSTIKRNNNRK